MHISSLPCTRNVLDRANPSPSVPSLHSQTIHSHRSSRSFAAYFLISLSLPLLNSACLVIHLGLLYTHAIARVNDHVSYVRPSPRPRRTARPLCSLLVIQPSPFILSFTHRLFLLMFLPCASQLLSLAPLTSPSSPQLRLFFVPKAPCGPCRPSSLALHRRSQIQLVAHGLGFHCLLYSLYDIDCAALLYNTDSNGRCRYRLVCI